MASARWLGFRLDMMSFALLATTAFAAVLTRHYDIAVGQVAAS